MLGLYRWSGWHLSCQSDFSTGKWHAFLKGKRFRLKQLCAHVNQRKKKSRISEEACDCPFAIGIETLQGARDDVWKGDKDKPTHNESNIAASPFGFPRIFIILT